jgi:NDP-sugar pyrophosphorylase family protein
VIDKLPFFILAGGYGIRARPLSLVKPKPIFPLHGVPLIQLLLEGFVNAGFKKGFINLHYKPKVIRTCIGNNTGLHLKYLYEEELSGSKILTRALPDFEEFLFIINGDVYMELRSNHFERMLDKVLKTDSDGILLLRQNNNPAYPSIITEKGIFKGKKTGAAGPLMYTGAALFKRKVIGAIDDISFFNSLARQNFKIAVEEYDGIWLDIGTPRLYYQAYKHYVNHKKTGAQVTRREYFSDNVSLSEGSRAQGSIIWENTELKGLCTISNCIVTGNLTLRDAVYSDKIIYTDADEIKITDFW